MKCVFVAITYAAAAVPFNVTSLYVCFVARDFFMVLLGYTV
jgi:hypothetical protein